MDDGPSPPLLQTWRRAGRRARIIGRVARGYVWLSIILSVAIWMSPLWWPSLLDEIFWEARNYLIDLTEIVLDPQFGRFGNLWEFHFYGLAYLVSIVGLLLGPVVLLLFSLRMKRLRHPERLDIRQPPVEIGERMRAMTDRAAATLGLADPPDVLVATRAAGASAGADLIRGRPTVVVTLGFLALMRRDQAVASAILAHEVAHLAQHDVQNFKLFSVYLRTVMPFLLVFAILNFLLALAEWPIADIPAVIFAQIAFPLVTWTILVLVRRRSERAADIGAAAVVGPKAVVAAIELLGGSGRFAGLSGLHPPPAYRLSRLLRAARLQPAS